MTKLRLPDVTLVMVETREHELARMAVESCLDVATFGEVLILTNDRDKFTRNKDGTPNNFVARCQPLIHIVPDWPEKVGWSRAWWFDVVPHLRTRQTLNIQWDSWICDPSMWRNDFMNYDYIGAPWWYKDGRNVGNGGFSLVSYALKRYVADRRDKFPCDTSTDDDLLCRKYRPQLEDAGFRWAPEDVADQFSYEGCGDVSRPFRQHFGFHGMFNWPKVLAKDRLKERLEIASKSEYISNSYIMRSFCQANPDVVKDLLEETKTAAQVAA